MARHEMTLRIFRILHYLELNKQGLTVGEIHQRLEHDGFEVDKRTVHRDIELLQQAHIPLSNFDESRWKIAPFGEISQKIQFTYHEIFALYVARKSLDHLRGSPIHSALESFFMKIEKVLGSQSEMFETLLGNVAFRPQTTWQTSVAPLVLDTVYGALEEGHPLKIVYKAEGGEKAGIASERLIGPECIYFASGSVYLIGIDLAKNEPRTYALSRMLDVEMDTSSAYDKQGFSPEKMFKSSFGVLNTGSVEKVEIMLTGPVATYVSERRWHDSQETVRTSDGVLLKMEVKVNDELARFVLGLGPTAVVLKPNALLSRVEEMAGEILNRNKKKAS